MGYTDNQGNILQFAMPRGTAPLAIDVTTSAAVHGGYVITKRCKIRKIGFVVEVAIANDAVAAVVEFNRRPTIASASGEVAIGTLTLTDGAAAGATFVKEVDPVVMEVGDELSLEVATAGTDGTSAAGQGYYFVIADEDQEVSGNESNVTVQS